MRVICPHCNQPARVTSRNNLTGTVSDLYCQCMNTKECGASFVFVLSYKHDLIPPQKIHQRIVDFVNGLPAEQRKKLQSDIFV